MQTAAAGPTSPALVQAFHVFGGPLAYLDECARRYGDCFTLRIPTYPAPITFISDPEAVKEIFAADGTDLLESGSIMAPVMANVIGQHSMLIIDGAEHRRHRGLIMPYFMRGQFSRFGDTILMRGQFSRFGDTILKLTEREIARWPDGGRFPIRAKMRDITLQVILNLLFGEERAMAVISPEAVRQFFGRDPSPLLFIRRCSATSGR